MKKEPKQKTYRRPRIGEFVHFLCEEYKLNTSEVYDKLVERFPELLNKERCSNCNASMSEYQFTLDTLDALLLLGMGKIVGKRALTMPFHEANKVHLQTSLNKYYSVPSRSTQCSKLGLIAKVLRKNGTHDQKAGWLITRRGFAFLAGHPVPKRVQTFRNQITERFEETTTFQEIMGSVVDDVVVQKELSTQQDYKFNALETWAVAGFAQGTLI